MKPQDSWELEDVHDVHGWGDKRGCLCDTLNKSTVYSKKKFEVCETDSMMREGRCFAWSWVFA